MEETTIRCVLVSLLAGVSQGSAWGLALPVSADSNGVDVLNTSTVEVRAIVLLGLALLGTANLLRRRRTIQNAASSLKSVSGPAPGIIGRELCPNPQSGRRLVKTPKHTEPVPQT